MKWVDCIRFDQVSAELTKRYDRCAGSAEAAPGHDLDLLHQDEPEAVPGAARRAAPHDARAAVRGTSAAARAPSAPTRTVSDSSGG